MPLSDILPPENKTHFQKALLDALDRALPVPLRETLNPLLTPAEWLPWLAAHEGVPLWFDDWEEERKREIIAHSAGISPAHPGERLLDLIGTVAAAPLFLAYVDAQIVHKVSHPARYPVGRIAAGITPINHRPFVARYLVKTALVAPVRAICVARTAVGLAALRPVSREPLIRAKRALTVSKAPATAYSVTFAHRLPVTLEDGIDLDAGVKLGDFKDRNRL